jgi:alpha-L-fucosidase 2
MAIHPLGIVDIANDEQDRRTVESSLQYLQRLGTDWWVGYSYAWLGNLQARAHHGEEAAAALRTFAGAFVLSNSFHANGDQTRSGKSKFTYRPFTLEGNFAFAAGIQEMLLQSHGGRITIFPAVPRAWREVSFSTMRAEGGFIVSAVMTRGVVTDVKIKAESAGLLRLVNPFSPAGWRTVGTARRAVSVRTGLIQVHVKKGEEIQLVRKEKG